jgi:hypothetical protein
LRGVGGHRNERKQRNEKQEAELASKIQIRCSQSLGPAPVPQRRLLRLHHWRG